MRVEARDFQLWDHHEFFLGPQKNYPKIPDGTETEENVVCLFFSFLSELLTPSFPIFIFLLLPVSHGEERERKNFCRFVSGAQKVSPSWGKKETNWNGPIIESLS